MEGECEGLYRDDLRYTGDPQGTSSSSTAGEDRNAAGEKENFMSWFAFIGGRLLGVLMSLCWAACSQALGGNVPPFELNMLRFGSVWLSVAPIVLHKRLSLLFFLSENMLYI